MFGLASVYILVGLYTVFNIFTQRHFYRRRKKNLVFFLNSMVLIFSSTRATVLLLDPDVSTEDPSKTLLVLCLILHEVGTSCMTSTFSVSVLLMVLDTTKLSLGSPRLQKPGFLIGVWIINVVYLLISDLIVASFNSAKAMIFVSQVMFAFLPCLVIFVGFTVAAYKLWMNLSQFSRQTSHPNNKVSKESIKIHKLVILQCFACVEGFCLFVLVILMASGQTGVLNDSGHIEIWRWFNLPEFLRFVELLMCAVIFLMA